MEDLRAELERVDANTHQAPVDINMADTVPVAVPDLAYKNYGSTPTKMKLNNTGFTVTVSGKFDGDPPTISGGPLDGSYKFSQLHFHWGPNDGEGSEHTFEGRSVPLEMHMVHVNQKYATQEEALLKKDGVVILAFLFTSGGKHPGLDGVARGLAEIVKPHTSFKIPPQSLQSLCAPFQRDYFSYWGSVISPSCSHLIQWLICRSPLQASPDQVAAFRQLLNVNEEPLLRNYRDGQPLQGRTIFHLAPGSREGFSLNCGREQTCAAGEGRPAPGADVSVLSVEGPCTSLGEAESKGVVAVDAEGVPVERTPSGRQLERTPSGRLVERTPSGHLLEKTPSGRLLERTPSGHEVEKTKSGRYVQKTPSGRMLERTPSGHLLEKTESGRLVTKTPSGHLLEKTPSGHYVQKTPSGRLLEATPSGRLLERTPSGRLMSRTDSGHLVETERHLPPSVEITPSGHELTRTPSGRLVERTPSGHELEKTPSGRYVERTPSGHELERTPSGRYVQRTPSGHELEKTPSGRYVQRTPSGHELEKTPSGRYVQRTDSGRLLDRSLPGGMDETRDLEPQLIDTTAEDADAAAGGPGAGSGAGPGAGDKPGPDGTAGAERRVETTPSGRLVSRTASGRVHSMGSRVVSFSNLTGPIKERSASEWPDAPYEGPAAGSPVFVDTSEAVRLPCPPLQFLGHFQKGVGLVLTNSGETVEISLLKCKDRPVLQGGPLQGRYILDSAHFHWLPNDDANGGTHTINNARSEIECHMVHIHENYKSKTEAMDHPNGLAVVSVLHQVGGAECEVFMRLCKELPKINDLYTQVELPGLDLSYMSAVVKPHEYFLYPGRFFGREDGKALLWIVFPQPIGICCQNVAAFQNLRLSLDFRQHDTYPLGGRPLYAVVKEGKGGGAGDEDVAVGDLRRTASGRVMALRPDEWPNAPFASKHEILMAPLDIKTSTVPSIPMPPLEYRGHFAAGAVPVEMRNTGEAIDITWKEGVPVPVLVGGPLTDEYVFDSAHFHWAQNPDDVGAMHRINGKRCDLEFHLVHYKKSFKTRQDAMFQSDGLAVTSFLIQVGGTENESFAKLSDVLGEVKQVDSAVELSLRLDWLQNRATPHGFLTYPGTLFGADQGINVIWMVYPTPVQICCQHVAGFYKLDCVEYNRVHPLYDLLDRPIFHSINPDNCVT